MAHIPMLIEARAMYMDLFLEDLMRQRYIHTRGDGKVMEIQPNPMELRLFDMRVPEESMCDFLDDISPFWNEEDIGKSLLKNKMVLASKIMRHFGRLNKIDYQPTPSGRVRKKWVNIVPLGWKKDNWCPIKGELL